MRLIFVVEEREFYEFSNWPQYSRESQEWAGIDVTVGKREEASFRNVCNDISEKRFDTGFVESEMEWIFDAGSRRRIVWRTTIDPR